MNMYKVPPASSLVSGRTRPHLNCLGAPSTARRGSQRREKFYRRAGGREVQDTLLLVGRAGPGWASVHPSPRRSLQRLNFSITVSRIQPVLILGAKADPRLSPPCGDGRMCGTPLQTRLCMCAATAAVRPGHLASDLDVFISQWVWILLHPACQGHYVSPPPGQGGSDKQNQAASKCTVSMQNQAFRSGLPV